MDQLDATDPTRVGPYLLLGRLGTGGMGRVYLGRSAAGRTVAVKVVRPELARDAGFRERFRREVAAAYAVSGAFTAPPVDAEPDAEVPWMATRFVPGVALREAVARRGPLPVESLRMLLAGIAEALVDIHAAGLVHRDLKPANVMLALDGPHVIDFGIARAMDGTPFTAAGAVMGTPGYMAPEQCLGRPASTASDVFALGATILYAASGARPFGDGPVLEVLRRVTHDMPDLGAVPASLRGIVGECLAKLPEHRPGPRDLIGYVERGGPAAGTGSWLLPGLTADIVAVDQIMAGRAEASPPTDPSIDTTVAPPTATTRAVPVDVPVAGSTTTDPPTATTMPVPVAGAWTTAGHTAAATALQAPTSAPLQGPESPNRRKLIVGLVGVGVAASAGGVAAAVSLLTDQSSKSPGAVPSPGSGQPMPGGAPVSSPSVTAVPLPSGPAGALPPPTGLREMLDGPAAVERWTVTVKDPVLALSVRAGSLITSSGTGRQALDGTGKPRWTLPVASYVGTPGISASADERVLYLVGNSGPSLVSSVVAADSGTGAKLWSLPVPQPGWMASTVAGVVGDTVIVTGLSTTTPGQGFVWAVDARSRQTVWQLSGADAATVFVSPSGTKAVVGSKAGATDGQLQLIDVANGRARGWRKTMPRGFGLAVSVYGPGVVCWAGDTLVCATGELTALNGETGEQVWSFKTGNPMLQNCAASADGRWVFASGYQTLYCLDGRTGTLAWKIPLRSGLFPPNAPILSDSGNVYTIDAGGTLWAVDAATGTTRWKYHNPAASSSVATYWTAAGGRAYVAVGKTVTALDASGL